MSAGRDGPPGSSLSNSARPLEPLPRVRPDVTLIAPLRGTIFLFADVHRLSYILGGNKLSQVVLEPSHLS